MGTKQMRGETLERFRHAGFECFVRRVLWSVNGYVAVPPGHRLHGADYLDDQPVEFQEFPLEITFSEDARILASDLEGWWAFGFSTVASKDNEAAPGMVAAEVRRLAEILADLETTEP